MMLNVTKKIKVVDIDFKPVIVPILESETAAYKSYEYLSGYGKIVETIVEAQRGIEMDLQIEQQVKTVSVQSFHEWKSIAKTFFNETQLREIEQESQRAKGRAGFLSACFGVSLGGGISKYHEKTFSETHTDLTSEQEGFLKSVYDMKMENVKITGNIKVKGESFIPVKGKVMLLLGRIKFSDGNVINVINDTDPVLVNPDTNEKINEGAKITETSLSME